MAPTAAPPTDETFPLPAFEDRLWDELAALHSDTRAGRPRRRFYALAVAALAAAAAVAVVALVVDRGDDRVDTGDTPPAPDVIVVATSEYPAGNSVLYWSDEATGRNRSLEVGPDGRHLTEYASRYEQVPDGRYARVNIDVNHSTREWREYSSADRDPPELVDGPSDGDSDFRPWSAAFVADAVEVIDGRELLRIDSPNHLVCEKEPCLHDPWVAGERLDMITYWLDPETRRPVREISEARTLTQEVLDDPDLLWDLPATVNVTTTYEHLPRTPENIALTVITIPEGYKEMEGG